MDFSAPFGHLHFLNHRSPTNPLRYSLCSIPFLCRSRSSLLTFTLKYFCKCSQMTFENCQKFLNLFFISFCLSYFSLSSLFSVFLSLSYFSLSSFFSFFLSLSFYPFIHLCHYLSLFHSKSILRRKLSKIWLGKTLSHNGENIQEEVRRWKS